MYAGMAVWLGLGLYLCLLCRRQIALSRRISRLAALMEDPLPEQTPPESKR
jgi:CcmD family protein